MYKCKQASSCAYNIGKQMNIPNNSAGASSGQPEPDRSVAL